MRDLFTLTAGALVSHRLRSLLSMLGIAVGIGSVVLLTSIGEGTRVYLVSQFSQFGTNLLQINPGKAKTLGIPGVLGGTTHKLTLDDTEAISRLPGVQEVMPTAYGTARVESQGKARSVVVYGVTPAMATVWQWGVRRGRFWPTGDPRRGSPHTVLGPTVLRELFGEQNPLGRFVRIGGTRFQVTGVMAPKGRMLGLDLDDSVFIPVASAMRLFNTDELTEVHILYTHAHLAQRVENRVRALMIERHAGNEDFTLTSQQAMLDVFGNIMNIITMSVGAIAAISLLVGAVGILTMMWIAVGERTEEIGLLRSIGASRGQVQGIFLVEAALLATLGGLAGVAGGLGFCALLRALVAGLPIHTPARFVVAAVGVSLATGLLAGVWPARRAAHLDPIEALRAE